MERSPEAQQVIRMGVIGIGTGATAMVPVFASHSGFKWTAGCDLDTDVLESFGRDYGAATYTDATEMCRSADIDAVYIASPNRFHMEHTLAALEHGKHVLSEKPMTITLEDSDVMIEAAARAGVQLAVNVKHSFELRVLKLREFVTSGKYGRLRMIHSWYFNDWLYRPRTPEELNPEWGGGVPWRQGPHQLDIIRTVAGGMVRHLGQQPARPRRPRCFHRVRGRRHRHGRLQRLRSLSLPVADPRQERAQPLRRPGRLRARP